VVGYAVIAMGFSLEQGGHFMLLDELYLSHRARVVAAASRRWPSANSARGRGVSRLRLEVNHHNELARRLYLASGYIDDTRDLLTLPLDHPRPEGIL
jgi:hypothetical protein